MDMIVSIRANQINYSLIMHPKKIIERILKYELLKR